MAQDALSAGTLAVGMVGREVRNWMARGAGTGLVGRSRLRRLGEPEEL